jgi:hypothetical protein
VYRAKGKDRSRISFNDLTMPENLNYIKYNLQNSEDAFKMFEITQTKYESSPEIPAAIIQKLANRSSMTGKEFDKKMMPRYEYKNMLKAIQKNVEFLDNKQLVDTLFSIGKLHKHHSNAQLNKEYPDFARYFQFFIKDMMRESTSRMKELSAVQVAYLSKGLIGVRKLVNEKNSITEAELREAIKMHAIKNSD